MEHIVHVVDARLRRMRNRPALWLTITVATIGLAGAPAVAASTPSPRPTPTPPLPPSAIGDANAIWIQVSPAYKTTGLVIAVAADMTGCSTACNHLWASHDGGASWAKTAATGWNGGRPVIAVDGKGHEEFYALGNSGMQRSDDAGQTWKDVSSTGGYMPMVEPTYGQNGAVAVAGQHDYVLQGTSSSPVTGSNGAAAADYQFFFAPGYPSTGKNAPAFLSALNSQSKPLIFKCTASLACSGVGATLANEQVNQTPSFTSLAFSNAYASDGVVFAQANRDIYKSTDGGGTFAPLSIVAPDGSTATTTPGLALAPGFQEAGPVRTLYAAVLEAFVSKSNPHTAGNVYESDDAGSTWRPIATGTALDGGANAISVAPDGRIFAGYIRSVGGAASAGLLCSTDGHTWQASCPAVGTAQHGPVSGGQNAGNQGQSTGGGATSAPLAGAAGQAPPTSDGQVGATGLSTGGSTPTSVRDASMGWRTTTAIAALALLVPLAGASFYLRRRERRESASADQGDSAL
jgi:photosystem II stability/assembly factor-like uncharacterized protein